MLLLVIVRCFPQPIIHSLSHLSVAFFKYFEIEDVGFDSKPRLSIADLWTWDLGCGFVGFDL